MKQMVQHSSSNSQNQQQSLAESLSDLSQKAIEERLEELHENSTGRILEEFGWAVLKMGGLEECSLTPQSNVRMPDIIPNWKGTSPDLEVDYLIPIGEICLVGEITSLNINSKSKIKRKFERLQSHVKDINSYLSRSSNSDKIKVFQKLGGISSEEQLNKFSNVKEIKTFFVFTKINSLSDRSTRPDKVFYKSDFLKVIEYAQSIGKWARPYLLNLFGLSESSRNSTNTISLYEGDFIHIGRRRVVSDIGTFANMYLFEISPYELLDIAHVERKDNLNHDKQNKGSKNTCFSYQRLLRTEKLLDIRSKLKSTKRFTFPSNILVTLSENCALDPDGILRIPKQYGSISIVDGQHRLFSYANDSVKDRQTDPKILVLAVQFDLDQSRDKTAEINRCNASIFLEVNTTQDPVDQEFTQSLSQKLGSKDPESLAIGVVEILNNGTNYKGFFKDDNGSVFGKDGKIHYGPIQHEVSMMVKYIANIQEKKMSEKKLTGKQQKFYDSYCALALEGQKSESDLVDIGTMAVLIEKFMGMVKSNFKKNEDFNNKFLKYGRFWAGLIKLFDWFIKEGFSWEDIKENIKKMHSNTENKECNIPQGDLRVAQQFDQWKSCIEVEIKDEKI
jgi:DGQHR domain-containing protein